MASFLFWAIHGIKYTATFNWEGGRNFLTLERYANPYTDQIGALGTLKVTGTKGSTTFNGNPSEEWFGDQLRYN